MTDHEFFPDISAEPELLSKISGISDVGSVEATCQLLMDMISAHLWEGASYAHAEVIGELLAMATLSLKPKGLLSLDVLQRRWKEGFDSPVAIPLPLPVVGATSFLLCLIFKGDVSPALKNGAEEVEKYISTRFEISDPPIFEMDDINWNEKK